MNTPLRHGWSRAEQPWTMLREASFLARRWRSSPFAAPWHDRIPAVAGVYVITGSPPVTGPFAKAWCPLYVGQTSNLRSRFGRHLKGDTGVSTIRLFTNLHFYYHVATDDVDSSRLRHYEQLLQNAFGPIANTRNAIHGFTVGNPVPVWETQTSKNPRKVTTE